MGRTLTKTVTVGGRRYMAGETPTDEHAKLIKNPNVWAGGTDEGVPSGVKAIVLSWVGDDPERANEALEAESERTKPRIGVLDFCADILNQNDDEEDEGEDEGGEGDG